MNLKQQAVSVYNLIGKRLFGFGREELGYQVDGVGNNSVSRSFMGSYRGIVYRAIDLIAESVGRYEPILFQADGKTQVEKHRFLDWLYHPNENVSMYDLFVVTQSFDEIFGEWFWYIPNGQITKQPKGIYALRPDKMSVNIDAQGKVIGYTLRKADGTKMPFLPEEILHDRKFNPHNPYRGYGTTEAAMDYIGTEESTAKFTKNFFDNNAGLNGVLALKGLVSKESFRKFVVQWRQKYEGVDNAGKTAIIRDTDAAFTKVGLGLNELDMSGLRNMSIDEILMMYRVPRGLLGLSSQEAGLGRASVETLEYIFAKYNIDQKMTRIDNALQRAFDRYFPGEKLFVSHENVIPEDKAFKLEERKAGVDTWMTRNEVREAEGLDPVEGGDDLRITISSVPLSFDTTEPAAAPEPEEDKPADDEEDPEEDDEEKGKTIRFTLPKKKESDEEVAYRIKENFRLSLQRNQLRYEKVYRKTLTPIFKEQERICLKACEVLGKDLTSRLFNLSEAVESFDAKLYPVLVDMYLVQGDLALRFAGADEDVEFTLNSTIERYVHSNTRRMAKAYNEETLERLSASLSEGILAEESVGKLKKRVSALFADTRGRRAERIARTETLKASNQATNYAYKQTGYVTGKQWFANPGACEFCSAFDGKVFGLDDTFAQRGQTVEGADGGTYAVSYEDIENPPLHPNCRCTILPVR